MKPEEYRERRVEAEGWDVRLASYRVGATFRCEADNVSPGACLARTEAATREEAETQALERARTLLARTRRHAV